MEKTSLIGWMCGCGYRFFGFDEQDTTDNHQHTGSPCGSSGKMLPVPVEVRGGRVFYPRPS